MPAKASIRASMLLDNQCIVAQLPPQIPRKRLMPTTSGRSQALISRSPTDGPTANVRTAESPRYSDARAIFPPCAARTAGGAACFPTTTTTGRCSRLLRTEALCPAAAKPTDGCQTRAVRGAQGRHRVPRGDQPESLSLELHDEVLRCLVSLKVRVKLMRDETDDGRCAREGEQISGEILDTFNAVKRLIRGLRPPELEHRGLAGALRDHFHLLRDSGGFRVDARVGDVDDELDEATALTLYRVVQEAVANAARHSGERSAMVRVASGGGSVVAEIRDRGRGFELRDPGSAEPCDHVGVTGMTERAAMVGGDVKIETAPGRGTLVRLTVPVRGAPAMSGVRGP